MRTDVEPSLTYRQMRRRLRPARVITRIPRLGDGWQSSAMRMLENMSITWGGAGHLLAPVDDAGDLHPELWKLVELYDADQWAAYVYTWRGHQMADGELFDSFITREARRWARKHGGGIKRARELLQGDHLMTSPQAGWPPPDALIERLKRFTGPAIEGDELVFGMYRADGEPGHGVVDVADLEPLPGRVQLLGTQNLPLSLQLVLAMRVGGLAHSHIERLVDRGVSIESVLVSLDDLDFLLRLAWLGPQRSGRWSLHRSMVEHLGGPTRPVPPYVDDQFLDTTPLALSRLGCSQFSRWHPRHDDPLTVVVGSHADDFAYAMALDRCGVPAIWFPAEFVLGRDKLSKAVRESLARCLADPGRRHDSDTPSVLCSLTMTGDELKRLRTRLLKTTWGSQLQLQVAESVALPPYRIPSLMDSEHFDDPIDVPFSGDEMASGCPVVTPTHVRAKDPWKLQWWVEVDAAGHALPPRSGLNGITVAESRSWRQTARCGRDGISFPSHTMGFAWAGAPLEQLLERPRLRLPSAQQIFRTLATNAGLAMVESSAGRFRRLTLDLWGGLDNLAADLADPPRRKLLETWLSEKPSGVQPGIFTNSRRRFLNLDDVCDASGLPASESRSLVDRYLTDGVLRRGLALQCGHCVLFDWYEMDELGQSFMCRRCNSATLLASSAWKHASNEPAFYYDLAEVVYQALRQNARVPIAGLAALKHGSKSFLDLPEVELTDADGLTIELDLLAVVDGRIVIGEAKTGDRFHDSKQAELGWLRRFADVAAALTADEVVFATAAPAWRTLTAERIATVFGGMSAGVRLLEGL